ncbi:unnamed protein product [Bursaphelenchus xylophilus]|uniref:(pine wood nematode) hypothetical protein n=1 Tax=Bursaphelenchus xylophilus TaxID=6326 RepID=A0A1I7SM39_BURXY|nr:unnamed protein product [Bursaphelenchus xylophilus]CAG9129987.1 unnamed protein product [Bursaphelenchus xylophilus]
MAVQLTDLETGQGEENRNLLFTCNWILAIGERDEGRGISESFGFTTCYKTAAYDWIGHIYFRRRAPRFNLPMEGLDLYLEPGRMPLASTKPAKVRIGYTVYMTDEFREVLHHEPLTDTYVAPSVFGLVECYKAPTGRFKEKLAEFLGSRLRGTWRFVVTMELAFSTKSFLSGPEIFSNNLHAQPDDISNDFRFAFKKNPDFHLICSDGQVTASKLGLFLATEYFRELFLLQMELKINSTDHDLRQFRRLTVTTLVDYLMSNTIKENMVMAVEEVSELMQVVELLKPVRKDELRYYMHKLLINRLKQVAETRIEDVVKILLVANRCNFAQLKIMCYASVVNMHYEAFKTRYRIDAPEPEDREVFGQLQATRAFTFQSPLEFIDKLRLKAYKVSLAFA